MTDTPTLAPNTSRNLRLFVLLSGVAAGMVGLAYAAVPLYNLFCSVTGYGGTTQVSQGNANGVIAREMGVRFDATVPRDMPLKVEPAETTTSRIGAVNEIVFKATNLSDEPLATTAGFNVTPDSTGAYFNKIECFCFTEQTIPPHETVDMPVTYFVDPELDKNAELRTIREITLSYTFYSS